MKFDLIEVPNPICDKGDSYSTEAILKEGSFANNGSEVKSQFISTR